MRVFRPGMHPEKSTSLANPGQCSPRRVAAASASHLRDADQAVYDWLYGILRRPPTPRARTELTVLVVVHDLAVRELPAW